MTKKNITIGVLALQGDVLEHVEMMDEVLEKKKFNTKTIKVKKPEQLENLDGLIIPGGESTVMSRLTKETRFNTQLMNKIKEKVENGLAILGTCAGSIMVSKSSSDKVVKEFNQEILELMDIEVIRNRYGRQQDSFEKPLTIKGIEKKSFPGVFIRAPIISKVGKNVDILSQNGKEIYAVKQDKILAVTFHPELTDDTRIHEMFLKLILS